MYRQYKTFEERLIKKGTPTNEKLLYHGTPSNSVENICRFGFDRNFCGVHGKFRKLQVLSWITLVFTQKIFPSLSTLRLSIRVLLVPSNHYQLGYVYTFYIKFGEINVGTNLISDDMI